MGANRLRRMLSVLLISVCSSVASAQESPQVLIKFMPANANIPVFFPTAKTTWSQKVDVHVTAGANGIVDSQNLNLDTSPIKWSMTSKDEASLLKSGRFDAKAQAVYGAKLRYLYNNPHLGLTKLDGQRQDHFQCIQAALGNFESCVSTNYENKLNFPSCIRQYAAVEFRACCITPLKDGTALNQVEREACTAQNYPWTGVVGVDATADDSDFTSDLWYKARRTIRDNANSRGGMSPAERAVAAEANRLMNSVAAGVFKKGTN